MLYYKNSFGNEIFYYREQVTMKRPIAMVLFLAIILCSPLYAEDISTVSEREEKNLKIFFGNFVDVSKEKVYIEPFYDFPEKEVISSFKGLFLTNLKKELIANGYDLIKSAEVDTGLKLDGEVQATTSYKCSTRVIDKLTFGLSYILDTLSGAVRKPNCYHYGRMNVVVTYSTEDHVIKKRYAKSTKKKDTTLTRLLVDLSEKICSEIIQEVSNIQKN
jgi:hypothetical protein